MEEDTQLPCGGCDIGIYAIECIMAGADFCVGKNTKKDALRNAPRCKRNVNTICKGARDFIVWQSFPFTEDDKQRIVSEIHSLPGESICR